MLNLESDVRIVMLNLESIVRLFQGLHPFEIQGANDLNIGFAVAKLCIQLANGLEQC
jgi:hypothetical protein